MTGRALSRATGHPAPGCATDIGYLAASKADKATRFTELMVQETKTKRNRWV